jgi:hypothetical protein
MPTIHAINDDITSEPTRALDDGLEDELDEQTLRQIVGGMRSTAVPCSSCGSYPCICRP